jgi:hypothetical protein
MSASWKGVFAATTTQFQPDQSLDIPATLAHLDRMIKEKQRSRSYAGGLPWRWGPSRLRARALVGSMEPPSWNEATETGRSLSGFSGAPRIVRGTLRTRANFESNAFT